VGRHDAPTTPRSRVAPGRGSCPPNRGPGGRSGRRGGQVRQPGERARVHLAPRERLELEVSHRSPRLSPARAERAHPGDHGLHHHTRVAVGSLRALHRRPELRQLLRRPDLPRRARVRVGQHLLEGPIAGSSSLTGKPSQPRFRSPVTRRAWPGRSSLFVGLHPPGSSSGSAVMPLAPGAELGDELLGLVELAAEPIPLFRRAPREPLARVARIELADRGDALPLLRSELRDSRRPLPLAVSALPSTSGPHESNLWGPVPDRRGANQRARARRSWKASSSIDALAVDPFWGERSTLLQPSCELLTDGSRAEPLPPFLPPRRAWDHLLTRRLRSGRAVARDRMCQAASVPLPRHPKPGGRAVPGELRGSPTSPSAERCRPPKPSTLSASSFALARPSIDAPYLPEGPRDPRPDAGAGPAGTRHPQRRLR
jgi:hypothetical protein